MKSERDFRNYFAGAALAFGIVLSTFQLLILFSGRSAEELMAISDILWDIVYLSNLAGSIVGGYLVARYRRREYIQTGTTVAVITYIFESIYNFVFERLPVDIFVFVSLLVGGIIGSIFFRLRLERAKLKKQMRSKN